MSGGRIAPLACDSDGLAHARLARRLGRLVASCTMKLPGGHDAIVDLEKLRGDCLDPEHPRGKHKARVFRSALGLAVDHANLLREALLSAAEFADAEALGEDEFGSRYLLDFEFTGPSGTATVRSRWIIRRGEHRPRLTTCYVK